MNAGAPTSAPALSANARRRDMRAAMTLPVFCNASSAAKAKLPNRALMLHHLRDEQSCVSTGSLGARPDLPRRLDGLAAGGAGGALHRRAVHRSDRLRAAAQRHRPDALTRSLPPLL